MGTLGKPTLCLQVVCHSNLQLGLQIVSGLLSYHRCQKVSHSHLLCLQKVCSALACHSNLMYLRNVCGPLACHRSFLYLRNAYGPPACRSKPLVSDRIFRCLNTPAPDTSW